MKHCVEVLSASLLDGSTLDLLAPFQDVSAAPEVDVGGRQVVQVLVIAAVIVVVDEAGDGALEVTGQVVVFEQDGCGERALRTCKSVLFAIGFVGSTTLACSSSYTPT